MSFSIFIPSNILTLRATFALTQSHVLPSWQGLGVVMQHILVCLDCSELSKQVIPYAVSIAHGFGAKITILHVLEKQTADTCSPIDCFEWEMKKNEANRYLSTIKSSIENCDFLVTTEIMEGRPAEQISLWINTHDVDLTVLCSHGSNGKSQWSLASTTQKLITGTSIAVMLIPAEALDKRKSNDNDPVIFCQRILVPLDGSSWAESALPFAINIAKHQQCEVILTHVIPEPGIINVEPQNSEGLLLEQHIRDYNWRAATHYLNQIESRLKSTSDISINTSLMSNHSIHHELLNIIADQKIDMVVLSAHGGSNHQKQLCGKVALDLIVHCPVPVILLRGKTSHVDMEQQNTSSLVSAVRLPSQAIL